MGNASVFDYAQHFSRQVGCIHFYLNALAAFDAQLVQQVDVSHLELQVLLPPGIAHDHAFHEEKPSDIHKVSEFQIIFSEHGKGVITRVVFKGELSKGLACLRGSVFNARNNTTHLNVASNDGFQLSQFSTGGFAEGIHLEPEVVQRMA